MANAFPFTFTQDCASNVGYAHLTAISDDSPVYAYRFSRQSDGSVVDAGSIRPDQLPLDFDGLSDDYYTLLLTDQANSARTSTQTITINCGGTLGAGTTTPPPTGGGTTTPPAPAPPAGPSGCTTPRALNYDPAATQDTSPSSCVFFEVSTLADLVAAHLPIPLVVRASPTIAGLACLVRVRLLTAPDFLGGWTEFGQLVSACDDTATATFNLSEAAKSLLRIQPPVESGVDTSLSALLQVGCEVLDPATLAVLYTGLVGPCRVLNAVVEPVSGAVLTTPTPHVTMPVAAALWTTSATLAGGVVATLAPLDTDGCTPRQFVWLNAAGVWDSGFFYGRHLHGTDQADPVQYRDAFGADRYAKRGVVRSTLQVYSDKLDFATYLAINGIRDAIQVYERVTAGEYLPVLVATDSYVGYQEQTDKTFAVNFTVSYPAQLIQTQ